MIDRPTCETCPFYHESQRALLDCDGVTVNLPSRGDCRIRSAPGYFPPRSGDQWCGEHPAMAAWLKAERRPPSAPGLMAMADVAPSGVVRQDHRDIRLTRTGRGPVGEVGAAPTGSIKGSS